MATTHPVPAPPPRVGVLDNSEPTFNETAGYQRLDLSGFAPGVFIFGEPGRGRPSGDTAGEW